MTDKLQEHIKAIANNIPIIVFAVNRDLVYTMSEGQALETVGLRPGEAVGRKVEDVYRDSPQIVENLRRALSGETFTAHVSLRGRIFASWYSPSRDESGQVIGAIGFANDVTERQKEADNLQRALSLTEATLESTVDGILVFDRDGKVVRYNRKLVELWRIPADILAKCDDARALKHVTSEVANPAWFTNRLDEINSQPESFSQDVVDFDDGRVFDCYSQPQKLNGEVIGRVWSFRDITAQRRAEAELEKRNRELEKMAHFLSGRENNLVELKQELKELQKKCGIVKGDKGE